MPLPAGFVLAGRQILADEIVELRGAQRLLKRLAAAQRAVEAVGAEQVFVVEDDVVDADDLVLRAACRSSRPGRDWCRSMPRAKWVSW